MSEPLDGLNLATDVELLGGGEEVLDAGVGVVVAAEDLLGLGDPGIALSVQLVLVTVDVDGRQANSLVGPVDVLYGQDGEGVVVTQIAQGDAGTGLEAELVDLLL